MEEEGLHVAVVVLGALAVLGVDGALEALRTRDQEAGVALVAVEDEWPQAGGDGPQGLLASAQVVVPAKEFADVIDVDDGGHVAEVVRTVEVAAEPPAPEAARA